MAKFMILALPRSRTAWLAEWLTFDGKNEIVHDLAVECGSVQDFEDGLEAVDGAVETGAVLAWRLIREWHPEIRLATVHRPLGEVLRSLERLGLGSAHSPDMEARLEMLRALAQQPGVQNFAFDDLGLEIPCARLWEHCLGQEFDFEWWKEMAGKNVQIDMKQRLLRLRANAPALDRLKLEIVYEVSQLEGSGCRLN
jgi:hypothetical protein